MPVARHRVSMRRLRARPRRSVFALDTRAPLDSPPSEIALSAELGHRTITAADVVFFGGATGDYARLHFDHELAAAEPGSPPPIVHGLLSAAWALGALTWNAPSMLAADDPDAAVTAFSIRLERSVRIGDRLALRHRPASESAAPGLAHEPGRDVEYLLSNVRGERTARGVISVRRHGEGERSIPPMERPVWRRDASPRPLFADDLIEFGPRGESIGRTLSEADVVGFTNWSAERRPLYLNTEFAGQGRFGGRIVPPILVFCLGFGDFLRDLLSAELPATGMAGHLGDVFRCWAPVRIGDTVRTRHRPVRVTPSRGRPGMCVVHFALELLNQRDELVQDGEVAMFIPARAARP